MHSPEGRSRASARPGRRGPDFIGIGAQRTGTSWMYACLYEHPRICMPRKEINFFSRDRNWSRGFGWYEDLFAECSSDTVSGEFSTSYLTASEAPRRIGDRYPEVRLIVSLRHPVDRAYSNYMNDIVAGVVPRTKSFSEALESHPEYLEAGRYARYLQRYLERFPREQLLVSIFDEARRDPLSAIQDVYRFLGVEAGFQPSMIDRRVGIGRVPRFQLIERLLLRSAAAARRRRPLRPLWWTAKRIGIGDRLRALNTAASRADRTDGLDPEERRALISEFEPEIRAVEELLDAELPRWRR